MLRLFAGCALCICLLAMISCQETPTKTPDTTTDITKYDESTEKEDLIKLDGEIISIPSPIQAAIFIKDHSAGFNQLLLLDAKNLDPYQTNAQKAIALGVYGAELGYVSLYQEDDMAIGYMNTARKLADDIGISNAFDESLVQRFSNNMGIADSMVVMVSDIYEAADSYLKTNERNEMASLILFGGWIESLYITTKEAQSGNVAIQERLAQQKNGFDRLYKLISRDSETTVVKDLMPKITALKTAFSQVTATYMYQHPEVDLKAQKTILKSTVDYNMSSETMAAIIAATKDIRNHITGKK